MKTLKYISILLVLLTFSQCRTLEEYNVSPNNMEVGSAGPEDMMDEIICNGAVNYQTRFYDTYAELMQYTCVGGASNEVIHRYFVGPSYIESSWSQPAKWAANADHMYQLALAEEDENYQAIAITLRTYWMDMLSAIFGRVPFSEAFRLRSDNINKPKFDSEREVYTQLIKDLDLANSLYDTSKALSNPGKDKLYNGNVSKWKKFTNSLQLRILMRLSNRSSEMEIELGESIAQKINRIMKSPAEYPIMSSIDDNAVVYFSGEAPFQNPWGSNQVNSLSGHRGSEYFISVLNGKNDPRKWIWFIPWSASIAWMGVQSGMAGDDTATAGYPILNYEMFNNYNSPVSFMNYDEVCFILAEACIRTNDEHWAAIGGTAQAKEWYEKGIRASCEYWRHIYRDIIGLNGRDENTYLYRNYAAFESHWSEWMNSELVAVMDDVAISNFIANSVPFDVKNGLKCIIEQKYVAMFRVGVEGWADYRRTGYPQLTIGLAVYNNGILPMRLTYPVKTRTTNPDRYQECVQALRETYYDGGDDMLTPVWWSEAGLAKEIR